MAHEHPIVIRRGSIGALRPASRFRLPSVAVGVLKNAFQAALLMSLALGVVGILWNHELGTAETIRRQSRDEQGVVQVASGASLSRSELTRFGGESALPDFPNAAGSPEQVKTLLREGTIYEVTVKGGLVARPIGKGYAQLPQRSVAYMFEMKYCSTIEKNDGIRIVERRWFESIRMAKIVSQAVDMSLDLKPGGELVLDRIDFPDPDAGIVLAPASDVAGVMLATGVRSVVSDPSSRTFLEQDVMSGRSVRLTHLDGVGVESVEALDQALTDTQTCFLFSQPVLPGAVLPVREANGTTTAIVGLPQLSAFLEPLRIPDQEIVAVIESPGSGVSPGSDFSVHRVSREYGTPDGEVDPAAAERTPMGMIRYDSARGIVTSASFNWMVRDLDLADDRLFFERDFGEEAALTVHYHCKAS
jgi:hypothetical protein